MIPAVYLDTNAIIEFVEKRDERLADLFSRAEDGVFRLVTSQLSLAELLVRPIREDQSWLVELYEQLVLDPSLIEAHSVDLLVLRRSAELRVKLGSKLPDSIHVATAVMAGCSWLISSDRRLRMPDGVTRVVVKDLDVEALEIPR